MNPRYIPLIFFFLLSILSQIELNGQNIIPTRNFANNGYDYIDSTTKKIVSQYTYNQAFPFSEGLARVSRNGLWGFIDKNGDEVIKPRYSHADDFKEGIAPVGIATEVVLYEGEVQYRNYRHGMIDKEGRVVIDFKYGYQLNFNGNLSTAKEPSTNKWGWIDKSGNWKLPAIYDENENFNKIGLAKVGIYKMVSYDGVHYSGSIFKGLINKEGQIIIPTNYYDLGSINEDIIRVTDFNKQFYKGKSGFVNQKGQTVIPFIYDEAEDFIEGYARVGILNSNELKFGFIEKNGNLIIPAIMEYAHSFSSGKAFIKLNGRFGWIDSQGKLLANKMYDMAEDFNKRSSNDEISVSRSSKLALVSNNGLWGAVTVNGKVIIDIEYDSLVKTESCIIAEKSNLLYYFDNNGNLLKRDIPKANSLNSDLSYFDFNTDREEYYFKQEDEEYFNSLSNKNKNVSRSLLLNKEYGLTRRFNQISIMVKKRGNYFGIISSDSTQLTEFEYDSLHAITNDYYLLEHGIIGYKKYKTYLISVDSLSYTYNYRDAEEESWSKFKILIIPTDYSEIINLNEFSSSHNLFRIKKLKSWGVGKLSNNQIIEIIQPKYENIGMLPCEYCAQLVPVKYDGKWGFCDLSGEIKIPFQFQEVGGFNGSDYLDDENGGNFCQVMKDNKWGIINKLGQQVYPNELEDILFYRNGLCGIKKDGKWGYVNVKGEIIIPTIFNKIREHYEASAMVKLNKMQFMIGHFGEWRYENYN